ncbi:CheR family methyltransferase [Chitinophaga ginsengisoli]|uniref:Two-component system CheB/CheR fusion protein n=1 Tax=Chitinophaga ginsengisoli TaxID=363837 RepID=A0A2P8GHG8_9BACT|nr:CheR family methyltransferase [Chitinophaga ginsengisoli]PSL33408.1 two-component system CheB/CheR fusion protein [Chitinophaga ginsengisoli]
MKKANYIIAIGASAGGLEAIHEFFDNMPEYGNLSFVIIQHLSPDYKSLLVELVSKHTNMKVREVEEDMSVENDCIYVIPNNKEIIIEQGRLRLLQKPAEKAPNTAIDTFLFSLAKDKGSAAICIILSGTGTDGTKGATAIKRAGGMVMAQDPDTAKFDGMPRSVISAESVDYILAPEFMPSEIYNYVQDMPAEIFNGKIEEHLLTEIFQLVKQHSGQDFNNYKSPTITRRIAKRMAQFSIKKVDEYLQMLRQNGEENKALAREFLIGVTCFFRDKTAFRYLQEHILTKLVEEKEEGSVLKIWVTACSTGEEAYTLAMLLDQCLHEKNKWLDVKIFATDLDSNAIEHAARGIYPATIAKDVEPALLKKYFIKEEKKYRIAPRLRKQIVFARHNILKDPPFIKNDLVTCRNMLIYMENVLQRQVLSSLHFALNTGGYLFLGPSESASMIRGGLEEVHRKWKIYRKTDGTRSTLPDNLYSPLEYIRQTRGMRSNGNGHLAMAEKKMNSLMDEFREVMTEEFGFAAVYIDKAYEIQEAIGNYKKYLSLPEKKLHLNLLKMVPGELSMVLNITLRQAWAAGKKAAVKGVKVNTPEGLRLVNLLIKPDSGNGSGPFTLIVFNEDESSAHASGETSGTDHQPADVNDHVMALEAELNETRTNLQMAIEGLETSNEELLSSNQELLSANEELQSSNEELQSLNEELHTLNTEHQLKIKELLELNDDMDNYFRSTDIGQVFVDTTLRIRKFNPAAVKMINLIPSDIGRPIHHISTNILEDSLVEDIHTVIKQRKIVEKETVLSNGHMYLMKILPYIRQDKQTDGVVITFVDVTAVKEAETQLRQNYEELVQARESLRNLNADLEYKVLERTRELTVSEERFRLVSKATNDTVWDWNMISNNVWWSDNFYTIYGYAKDGTNSRAFWLDNIHPEDRMRVKNSITRAVNSKQSQWSEGYRLRCTDGSYAHVLDRGYLMMDENGKPYRMLGSMMDVTSLRHAEELAAVNREEKLFLAESMPLILWTADPQGVVDFVNEQFIIYTGKSLRQLQEEGWKSVIHPDDIAVWKEKWQQAVTNKADFSMELRIKHQEGTYDWFLHRTRVRKDIDGGASVLVGTSTDINEQKMAAEIMERRIQERTLALQRANQELESSNAELQQYAFVASHDLKEPLRKIHMFGNMLKERYQDSMEEKAADYLNRIINSSSRMTNLINDLLRFSRLSQVNFFEQVDLNAIIKEILSDLEILIQEKNAIVTVSPMPVIEAVPGQLRQVFQNLLSNAFKFSGKNVQPVIHITANRIKEKRFESESDPEGPFVCISITDNGIGFDEKYLDKIFVLFQRLHTKDQYEGTGIGLAVTRKIIDKHNGLITAHSREKEGATFTIILPVRQEQPAG